MGYIITIKDAIRALIIGVIAFLVLLAILSLVTGTAFATEQRQRIGQAQGQLQGQAQAQRQNQRQNQRSTQANTQVSNSSYTETYQASAPAFSGMHSCAVGSALGASFAGGSFAMGANSLDTTCMLMFIGQHKAALVALANSDRKACKALVNVGAISSDCGTKVGNYAKSKLSGGTKEASYSKCEYDKRSHSVSYRGSAAGKAACLTKLGW